MNGDQFKRRSGVIRFLPFLATLVWLTLVSPLQAGMTVYGLKDVYRLRLEDISFFLVTLLVSGLIFRFLWNHAVKGFDRLPRISYLQSLSLCVLIGLGMLLILTMISGIREVLTPGAWRRQGSTYRLNDPAQEPARRHSMEQLRVALFEYARTHDGKFPAHDFVPEIPEKLWESPDQSGTHYYYKGGLTTNVTDRLLAVEPPVFGESRFVLLTSGSIEKRTDLEISNLWSGGGK